MLFYALFITDNLLVDSKNLIINCPFFPAENFCFRLCVHGKFSILSESVDGLFPPHTHTALKQKMVINEAYVTEQPVFAEHILKFFCEQYFLNFPANGIAFGSLPFIKEKPTKHFDFLIEKCISL